MATGGSDPAGAKAEEKKLECGICLERYRRPKLLPCFHTFCQACLQTVAGMSTSFPCPACRAAVVVPPGGVGALQTNFYIEEDLDNEPTHTKLCEVCADQREATQKCLQCKQKYCDPCRRTHDAYTFGRSHTIISLQNNAEDPDNLKGKPVAHSVEEKCLKHPKHDLILYCAPCKTNICMQCKLTSHEGHPTEDLADAGVKVKGRVEAMLKRLKEEKAVLDGVMATADAECSRLGELRKKSEEDIEKRAKVTRQWVSQAVESAMDSVRSITEWQTSRMRAHIEDVVEQHAALVAQCDHVTRVLASGVDADIVSVEAQMTEVAVDRTEMKRLQEMLKKEATGFICRHNPSALGSSDVLAFVGMLEKIPPSAVLEKTATAVASPSRPSTDQTAASNTLVAVTPTTLASSGPKIASTSSLITGKRLGTPASSCLPATVSSKKSPPKSIVYSSNPNSRILAICPTSQNRIWVMHSIETSGKELVLLDKDSKQLETRPAADMSFPMMTILGDITISKHATGMDVIVWFQPGGGGGKVSVDARFRPCCKSAHEGGYLVKMYKGLSTVHSEATFDSLYPFKWKAKTLIDMALGGEVCDTSASRRHIAVIGLDNTSVTVYTDSGSDSTFGFHTTTSCTYTPGKRLRVSDACFCLTDGREMLLVAVEGKDNKVHLVDYNVGCRWVRYLDTGPKTLDRPVCLATDYSQHVWIGCHGGRVILVYL